LRFSGEMLGQNFDGNSPIETSVAGTIDLAL
jgi:hypothetical protein